MNSALFFALAMSVAACSGAATFPEQGLFLSLDAAQQPALRHAAQLPPLGNGRALDRWLSSSGASPAAIQPWQSGRPLFRSDDSEAFVRFDGKDDFLMVSGPRRQTRSITAFFLAAPRSNRGGFQGLFAAAALGQNDYTSGMNLDLGPEATAGLTVLNFESAGSTGFRNLLPKGHRLGAGAPFDGFHLFTVRSQVGAEGTELFVDGNPAGTRPRSDSSIGLEEIVVGARLYSNDAADAANAQGSFHGDISAVLLYDRALADADRKAIEERLTSRIPALNALASGARGHALETLTDPPVVQVLVPGFSVEELSIVLRNQNNLRYRHDGVLVGLGYDGRIHLVTDSDGDGREDKATVFWDKSTLRGPIGIALLPKGDPRGEGVFVASKGKVSLILDKDRDGVADEEVVVATGWKEIPQNVDAVGMAVDPRDGSIYFCLGTANYANGYLVDAATGVAHYDLGSDRGTVQRVSSDFKKRETVCTGIRFTCALAFNRQGDLFASEQEGATWLPNGNPLDELLHILPGRHYGFPPRHPRHLPQVVDEPSTFDYAPQHQSTVGMVFNEGVNGGPAFGPDSWSGDALMCGESRGKLYRTRLVKTAEGYVAQNQLFACLGMLTVDTCVTPKGDLLVACHSGPPDWGTGPAGDGKVFRIRYTGRDIPQPTLAWSAGSDEFRIAFDRPLKDADWAGAGEKVRVEAGRFVSAGDRYEVMRPGYQVVRDQMGSPRRWVPVQGLSLSEDRRTLVLRVTRQTEPVTYALTLPMPPSWVASSPIAQKPEIDLAVTLNGVQATLADATNPIRIILPHPSPKVARAMTVGSADHDAFFRRLDRTSTDFAGLSMKGGLTVGNVFVPAVQPGAKLDWDLESDAFAQRTMEVRQDLSAGLPSTLDLKADGKASFVGLDLTFPGPLSLNGSGLSFRLDDRARPIGLGGVFAPWTIRPSDQGPASEVAIRADVRGHWLRGRRVFFGQGSCATCHVLRGEGTSFGPDLSNLIHRDRDSVLSDILKPSATLNPDQTGSHVTFKDGTEVNGILGTLDAKRIVIRLPAGAEMSRAREEVASIEPLKNSLMPEGLGALLSKEQMEDLLTFLLINPLEPARITRTDPSAPAARSRTEVAGFLPSPLSAVAASVSPLRLLLCVDDQDHGTDEHDYPRWQERWSTLLALAEGVTVSKARGFPSREGLMAADVVIFYSRNAGWGAGPAGLLDEFQAKGGGLVYLHWAMEGGKQAESLAERIGLATVASGGTRYRHGEMELTFAQPAHPITRGFTRLKLLDETYWAYRGDKARVSVLARAVEEALPRIQIWTLERHQGRVFGCIPGHYTWTFDDPLYRVLVLRGIAWAGRQENVDRLLDLALVGARFSP